MNDISELDRTEEDVLTYEVSDEEMEAAAGEVRLATNSLKSATCCFGC
jgi:hypothetical protein